MISAGTLHYSICPGGGHRLVLEADQGIVEYHRWLLPKWMDAAPQRYAAHVSVIRRVVPPKMSYWGIYEGESVLFEYSHIAEWDDRYVWLPVRCKRIEEIRVELGLEPIVPWRNGFHLTIGNFKDSP